MLADHELQVETAESAEAALEFLTTRRPDVIFMDHMMPGMDGFQAVKAIKENPATATIPVMMYTSQSGELYVGQARALGAVGVLPKQIKPVEVGEVLRSLRLLGGDAAQGPARRASDLARRAGDSGLSGIESVNAPADWSDLHRWLQEMLADHNRALRMDLEATISRVLTDHPPGVQAATSQVRAGFWPSGVLILVLSVIAATFIWLHLDSEAKWRAVTQQNIGLLSELNARRASDVAEAKNLLSRNSADPAGASSRLAGIAAALEWSVNQNATYPPSDLPFGDTQQAKLAGLIDRLRAIDFRGTVRLESHVGDFCMRRTSDGTWAMAANDLPVARCDRTGLQPEEARTESARQSVAFANYMVELAVGSEPIRVELEPLGNSEPLVPYDFSGNATTAGDWNRVARQNQRVVTRLIAEAGTDNR